MTAERGHEPGGLGEDARDQEPVDPQDRTAFRGTPGATGEDGQKPHWDEDPGAYIGHEPERATETIPGGMQRADQRIAGVDTQGTGSGRPDERGQPADEPEGHRSGDAPSDDGLREAGQNR